MLFTELSLQLQSQNERENIPFRLPDRYRQPAVVQNNNEPLYGQAQINGHNAHINRQAFQNGEDQRGEAFRNGFALRNDEFFENRELPPKKRIHLRFNSGTHPQPHNSQQNGQAQENGQAFHNGEAQRGETSRNGFALRNGEFFVNRKQVLKKRILLRPHPHPYNSQQNEPHN